MATHYAIHPAIGIARVGDSPDEFYLAPEATGALPIACDATGNAVLARRRQRAADDALPRRRRPDRPPGRRASRSSSTTTPSPDGRPLKLGDTIQAPDGAGKLVDIHWYAYLANKKASLVRVRGARGRARLRAGHPLRNASVRGDARSALIVDPGPQGVDTIDDARAPRSRAAPTPHYTQTFPPPLDAEPGRHARRAADGRPAGG